MSVYNPTSGAGEISDVEVTVAPVLSGLEGEIVEAITVAEVTTFRPIISNPSDLKHLLECKADPNAPIKSGNISALRNVMSFAKEKDVAQMRDLLL